jgi:CheY-like chemotaxis protein
VILLDLEMPVMNEHRFLELREDPMIRQIPVVVLSGNPPFEEALDGIDTYLRKPVDADRLLRIVRTARG